MIIQHLILTAMVTGAGLIGHWVDTNDQSLKATQWIKTPKERKVWVISNLFLPVLALGMIFFL